MLLVFSRRLLKQSTQYDFFFWLEIRLYTHSRTRFSKHPTTQILKVFLPPLKTQLVVRILQFWLGMKRLWIAENTSCLESRHQLTSHRENCSIRHFREVRESQQDRPLGQPEVNSAQTNHDWTSVEKSGQIGTFQLKPSKSAQPTLGKLQIFWYPSRTTVTKFRKDAPDNKALSPLH